MPILKAWKKIKIRVPRRLHEQCPSMWGLQTKRSSQSLLSIFIISQLYKKSILFWKKISQHKVDFLSKTVSKLCQKIKKDRFPCQTLYGHSIMFTPPTKSRGCNPPMIHKYHYYIVYSKKLKSQVFCKQKRITIPPFRLFLENKVNVIPMLLVYHKIKKKSIPFNKNTPKGCLAKTSPKCPGLLRLESTAMRFCHLRPLGDNLW